MATRRVGDDPSFIRNLFVFVSGLPTVAVVTFVLWGYVGWWTVAIIFFVPLVLGGVVGVLTRGGRDLPFWLVSYQVLPFIVAPSAIALLLLEI